MFVAGGGPLLRVNNFKVDLSARACAVVFCRDAQACCAVAAAIALEPPIIARALTALGPSDLPMNARGNYRPARRGLNLVNCPIGVLAAALDVIVTRLLGELARHALR